MTLVPLLQYKLTVPKVGSISDLCTSLSNMSGVPAEKVCCHPPELPYVYLTLGKFTLFQQHVVQ